MPQPPHSTQPAPPLLVREVDVHLGARLGEREERRPEPGPRLRAEHRPREVVEGALEVRHRQVPVDGQALDLMEDRRVGRVEIVRRDRPGPGRPRRSAASG